VKLRARLSVATAAVLAVWAAIAAAAGPSLHEFVPADPREDVLLGATTPVGDLPAAIDTPSGPVSAPDPFRLPSAAEKAYARTAAPESSLFFPDRDTRPVPRVDYDDPFSPSLTPFKRLSAYDAVNADYTLKVDGAALRKVSVGGAASAGEDPFYADLTVDLAAGEAVRIPSVGPGMRILKLHTVPDTAVEVLRDGAENLFLRGQMRARVRVLLHLSAPRAAFGGPLRDSPWAELPPTPALPAKVQASADLVNRSIGVSRELGFRDAVDRLVAYYRGFATSDEPIPGKGDVFLDIAQSKKGVCRHRSFAFVVSALALRIPVRLVTNEAHAWVEVHDGALWHRIDLGGAAENFADSTASDRLSHVPPDDPFAWPAGSRPGRETAERSRPGGVADGGAPDDSSGGDGGSRTITSPSGSASARLPTTAPGPGDGDDARPPARIRLASNDREVFRNAALHLEGRVEASGSACSYVRVDVVLVSGKNEIPLGSLATDGSGAFQGAVVVPPNVTPGDYDVQLLTPGDVRCGKGRMENPQ
jgi:transglutaminase-like putative cysteine protease